MWKKCGNAARVDILRMTVNKALRLKAEVTLTVFSLST
jgi:hypothetical protein